MQLFPLFLIAAFLVVDQGVSPPLLDWQLTDGAVAFVAIAPVALIALLNALTVWWCTRQLSKGRASKPVLIADQVSRSSRGLIVLNHVVAVLGFDWLGAVRRTVGDLILIDELIALLPALFGLVATWWFYYPIERRLREALLIRRLDDGRPLYPTLSRAAYTLLQVRLHLLLMMVPLLAIMGSAEVIDRMDFAHSPETWAMRTREVLTFVIAVTIFIFSPLAARFVLDVEPMAPGALRDGLLAVCQRHGVRMRDLLVWKTNGSMINAAVMGLLGPLRYVMITDALLELLRMDQVRAVMAHEIGHVRRRHMPWMVGCLLACVSVAWIVVYLVLRGAWEVGWFNNAEADWIDVVVSVGPMALGLVMFGWVSRRFERQADTFAVQHLSGMDQQSNQSDQPSAGPNTSPNPDAATVEIAPQAQISVEAVHAMQGALEAITVFNAADPDRHSWRHGSIAWRQQYLNTIVGRPIKNLPIDRMIGRIKFATAVILIGSFAMMLYDAGFFHREALDETKHVQHQQTYDRSSRPPKIEADDANDVTIVHRPEEPSPP